MHDHVAAIQQDPVAAGQPLGANTDTLCLQTFRDVFGNRRNVALRSPARDDHVVGDQRFAD